MSDIKLPESELLIMQALWKSDKPLTSGEIAKLLPDNVSWKPSTLLTLISRLIDKGFIESEKKGRYFTYKPLILKSRYLQTETKSFLQRIHNNSLKSFIAALYESNSITETDIDEMLQWLKKKE